MGRGKSIYESMLKNIFYVYQAALAKLSLSFAFLSLTLKRCQERSKPLQKLFTANLGLNLEYHGPGAQDFGFHGILQYSL